MKWYDLCMLLHTPIHCATEADLLMLGKKLATELKPGKIIHLQGPLGAGKTTLIRGILAGLGYYGIVKSPTFTLVESYDVATMTIHHFDLYRLNDPLELEAIGFRDYFQCEALCLIEWPEKAGHFLPTPDHLIEIKIVDKGREVCFS